MISSTQEICPDRDCAKISTNKVGYKRSLNKTTGTKIKQGTIEHASVITQGHFKIPQITT